MFCNVIYTFSPYDGLDKILGVSTDSAIECSNFIGYLNDKIENAKSKDEILDLIDFCVGANFYLDQDAIYLIKKHGFSLKFKKVEIMTEPNYGYFNSTFLNEYDHYTSDYEYKPKPLDFDYDFDYELGVHDSLNIGRLANKLKKFNNTPTNPKRFDPEFAHYDVLNKFAYDAENQLHDFAHNKGCRNAINHIERMIEKYAKNGGVMVWKICKKIKSHKRYKSDATFRRVAKWYIDTLEQPNRFDYDSYDWDFYFKNYVYQNGCLMDKKSARKYWGYQEICDICGIDHEK